MEILKDINLKSFSTFNIGGTARYFSYIKSKQDIIDVVKFIKKDNLKYYILGKGADTIFTDGLYDGIILKIEIPGFEIIEDTGNTTPEGKVLNIELLEINDNEDVRHFPSLLRVENNYSILKIGAGEDWDSLVQKTVDLGLVGFEHMSLIPGTAGATPIQNVEAYRQPISSTLIELEAYDIANENFIIIKNEDCHFAYRQSRFKNEDKNKFIISSITVKLLKNDGYPIILDKEVKKHLAEKNIANPTLQQVRDGIIEIRNSKLPSIQDFPNVGSFFENVIVDENKYKELIVRFPEIKHTHIGKNQYKLYTGWLLQNCGIGGVDDARGYQYKDLALYQKHALTIVNLGNATYNDLQEFIEMIQNAIKNKFGVELELEPHFVS